MSQRYRVWHVVSEGEREAIHLSADSAEDAACRFASGWAAALTEPFAVFVRDETGVASICRVVRTVSVKYTARAVQFEPMGDDRSSLA